MFYIAYNKRSSVTAKNLAVALNARRINRKRFKFKPSVLLRWGNSYVDAPEGCIEINSIDAVRNAADKLLMARLLSSCESVPFPEVYFSEDGLEDLTEDMYFRNSHGIVVKRSSSRDGDLYATVPIDTHREFRVHVFDGKVIGVYEKIPMGEVKPKYFKSDTCNFKRLDMSSKEVRVSIKGVRPAAKAAVECLGLLFGGADVIMNKEGMVFVNEVNSAPSLNVENISRYVEAIKKYLENG